MKKFLMMLSIIIVFSLGGCAEQSAVTEEVVPEIVEPTVQEEVLEEAEPEEPEVEEEEVQGSTDPQVSIISSAFSDSTGEDFSWEATIETPEFENIPDKTATILSDYYDNVFKKYQAYVTEELPFKLQESTGHYVATFGCEVMYLTEDVVSIRRVNSEAYQYADGIPEITMYSETFSLESGGLLTLDAILDTTAEVYRPMIAEQVNEIVGGDMTTVLESNWENENFYVTETGLVVYFKESNWMPTYTEIEIPWENL